MALLVAYASKYGATRGIAERIARKLEATGRDILIRPVEGVEDVGSYEAFVLGSAVYFGSWLKEAAELVRRNHAVLAERPVWLFSSGPVGTATLPDPKEVAEFQTAITPRGHHNFTGALDRSKLSFGERLLVKAMKAPYGDFRDWEAIDAWAADIARELAPVGSTTS